MLNHNEILGTSAAKILKAITGEYVSVQFVDIEADTYFNVESSSKFAKSLEGITSVREAFDKNVEVIIKPEKREEARVFYDLDTLAERLENKKSISYEYEGALRGWCIGTFIPVERNDEGKINKVLYTVRYVDEERTNEMNQNKVIDALSRGFLNIFLANPSKNIGKIIKLNGYVTSGMNKNSPQDLDYRKFTTTYANDRVYEEDREKFLDALNQSYMEKHLENEGEYNVPYRIVEDDGSLHSYQAKVVKSEEDGWYVLAFQNIDSLVAQEKERADELQNALELAQRASQSKTDFLSRMSHDIRTPMNGIVGMSHIMEAEINNPDVIKDSIGKIKQLSSQLEILINEVLEMGQIESKRVTLGSEVVDLVALIKSYRPALQVMAEDKGIVLEDGDFEIIHKNIVCSIVHVQRIFMNIVTNAIKYNREQGTVSLIVKESPIDNVKSNYTFIVKDTGVGMSEEFLNHIYEPFVRENNTNSTQYEGTGLGMAIAKELLDLMNGTIEIQSELNKGTVVTMTIPFEISEEIAVNEDTQDDISLDGKHILIVEDNQFNIEIAKYILEEEHVVVDIATNGEEAVQKFKGSKIHEYDLILMDLMMPVMNGYDATKAIRKLDREDAKTIGIFAMTANAFKEDADACLSAGMNGHIAKPIDIDVLKRQIAKFL